MATESAATIDQSSAYLTLALALALALAHAHALAHALAPALASTYALAITTSLTGAQLPVVIVVLSSLLAESAWIDAYSKHVRYAECSRQEQAAN